MHYFDKKIRSYLLSKHELGTLLDEEMTEDEKTELQQAEEVCRRFLACDLEAGQGIDAKRLLSTILGRSEDMTNEDEDLEYL